MVQEELEAVLGEAGGTWDPVQAKEKTEKAQRAAALAEPVSPAERARLSLSAAAANFVSPAERARLSLPAPAKRPDTAAPAVASATKSKDTAEEEETNESQDKLYQMVQEELEAVLDEEWKASKMRAPKDWKGDRKKADIRATGAHRDKRFDHAPTGGLTQKAFDASTKAPQDDLEDEETNESQDQLYQMVQEELEAVLDEKWEASKMRKPEGWKGDREKADIRATVAHRSPEVAAAFKPEKEPPVATTPWRTEEDKAALDMPPDTGDDEPRRDPFSPRAAAFAGEDMTQAELIAQHGSPELKQQARGEDPLGKRDAGRKADLRRRTRQEGLINQMVQEELEAVIAERNR